MIDREDGKSLRSGFLANAGQFPDRPAVVVRGATYSYQQMEEEARRWANQIVTALGRRADRVGVFAYRSEVAYTSVIAALMSGAAFVPLSPTFPSEKTAAMIAQAQLDAIIVDKTCAPLIPKIFQGAVSPILLFPDLDAPSFAGVQAKIFDAAALKKTSPLVDLPPLISDDTAYLLFTSGSTGVPKGVPVTHGNAVHFLDVMRKRYQTRPDDRFSQTFDQTFDLSVFDMFMAWHSAACVYSLSPVELLAPTKFINQYSITIWFSVPSLAVHMGRRRTLAENSLPTLRWSLFCGEALENRTAEQWQAAAPNSIVENLYGPTELTIACCAHRWQGEASIKISKDGVVPIGRPLKGLGAIVVDEELKPSAEGEPGELCVCGPQTTPGYWQDPAKTQERFVTLPVSKTESRRFYRTGDRVIRHLDGEYIFLGRVDHQIKVLGHRVELGEIEAALRRGNGVSAAIAFGLPLGTQHAEAVLACVTGENIDLAALKKTAQEGVPAYAVPREFVIVDQMPLNSNGKIDRKQLRAMLEERAAKAKTS